MTDNFKQRTVTLQGGNLIGRLKISKLINLIQKHPYFDNIIKNFPIDSIKEDYIVIPGIDSAFSEIKLENEKYEKVNAIAETKDVSIAMKTEDEGTALNFYFDVCRIDDELKESLIAEAIYDSKSSFLDEYSMSKYANFLLEKGHDNLVNENIQYFKSLAEKNEKYNKLKSYRLLVKGEKHFLRGITSEKYNEYGIDFTFFVVMIYLHLKMINEKGSSYSITYLSLSESKLDMIVKDNRVYEIEQFGKVSHGIEISTNELGTGSLNATSIIRVEGKNDETMLYLLPRKTKQQQHKTKYEINHITSLENVFSKIKNFEQLLNLSEEFVNDINDIKGLKTPDQLRAKIQMKIENPNSVFKEFKELRDIFKRKISDQINNFSELLEMCKKAEELEIEYDIKDKLRYIISDIILYGNAQ